MNKSWAYYTSVTAWAQPSAWYIFQVCTYCTKLHMDICCTTSQHAQVSCLSSFVYMQNILIQYICSVLTGRSGSPFEQFIYHDHYTSMKFTNSVTEEILAPNAPIIKAEPLHTREYNRLSIVHNIVECIALLVILYVLYSLLLLLQWFRGFCSVQFSITCVIFSTNESSLWSSSITKTVDNLVTSIQPWTRNKPTIINLSVSSTYNMKQRWANSYTVTAIRLCWRSVFMIPGILVWVLVMTEWK